MVKETKTNCQGQPKNQHLDYKYFCAQCMCTKRGLTVTRNCAHYNRRINNEKDSLKIDLVICLQADCVHAIICFDCFVVIYYYTGLQLWYIHARRHVFAYFSQV